MLQERNLGIALLGMGLATSACVTALPAQRPNDTYTTVEGPVVDAGADGTIFLEDIKAELAKQGWTPVSPGEYEMKAAQLVARAAYEQRWSSSGVTSSPPNATSEKPLKALLPTKAPSYPVAQYGTAYGMVTDFGSWAHVDDYSTLHPSPSDVEDLVRDYINPAGSVGQARIGVAILPDPADAHRIFTAVIRDQRAEVSEGAPRVATPGTTFTIRGTWVAKDLTSPELLVLQPDGKVTASPLTTVGDGFSVSYTLPAAPGIYVVSLLAESVDGIQTFYDVAVFSGVEPTPWPPRPPEDAAPPGNAQDAATQVVQALEDWRVRHGLSLLPVKADLCAAAKAEAQLRGTLETKNRGGPYHYNKELGPRDDRLRAAGIDPKRTNSLNFTWGDTGFPYGLATFLEYPNNVRRLTNAEALGIGVIVLPKDNPDSPTRYRINWIVSHSEQSSAEPGPDRDHDGIPDAVDACPDEPGLPSLDPTQYGCPRVHVDIKTMRVFINQQIQFVTGGAVFVEGSDPLLQEIADALKAHPEILKARVEGYTDDTGSEERNLVVSRERAAAVVKWLDDHGIDPQRLVSEGYGPQRTVASNATEEGRQQNRRVEIHILELAPGTQAPTTATPTPNAQKLEPSTPTEKKASEVGHTSQEAPTSVPAPEKAPEAAPPAPAK